MVTVATSLILASKKIKKTAFYKNCYFKEAHSHTDDPYGINVDGFYNGTDILAMQLKALYILKKTELKIQLA